MSTASPSETTAQDRIGIRPCGREEAARIAAFMNQFAFHNRVGSGTTPPGEILQASDVERFFDEQNIALFMVMEYDQDIIGILYFANRNIQMMCEDNAIFAVELLIHPEYRQGPLTGRFFSDAAVRLLQMGYDYIDATVYMTNQSALALYKRIGMYRSGLEYMVNDGQIKLRSYLPYLIKYVREGLKHVRQDINERFAQVGWKGMVGSDNVRSGEEDALHVHGMRVMENKFQFGDRKYTFWLDLRTEKVVMIDSPYVRFFHHVVDSPQLVVGQQGAVRFECQNLSEETATVKFRTTLGGEEMIYHNGLSERELAPGESITWDEPLCFGTPGDVSLRTELEFDVIHFDFETLVEVRPQVSIENGGGSILSGEALEGSLLLTNHTAREIEGLLLLDNLEPNHVLLASASTAQVVLPAGEQVQVPLHVTGLRTGLGRLQARLFAKEGGECGSQELQIPVTAPQKPVRYATGNREVLDSAWLSVQVDTRTGNLHLYDRQTGQELVQEAWPDLGFPFQNGIRESGTRSLEWMDDTHGAALLIKETRADGRTLVRRISFTEDRQVRIEDYTPDQHPLKIYPFCLLRDTSVSVPLQGGTIHSTVLDSVFPYGMLDYEWVNDLEFPSDPDAYAANWTAFDSAESTVGMLWHGDVRSVHYGMRFMPALTFHGRPSGKGGKTFWKTQPPVAVHSYVLGYGGAREVERLWQAQSGHTAPTLPTYDRVELNLLSPSLLPSDAALHTLRAEVSSRLLKKVDGTLTLRLPALNHAQSVKLDGIQADAPQEVLFELPDLAGLSILDGVLAFENDTRGLNVEKSFALTVVPTESTVHVQTKKSGGAEVYEIDNGVLTVTVAPHFQGAITSLKYNRLETVSSNYPKLKNHGTNYNAPCGFHPQWMDQAVDPIRHGVLFYDIHQQAFTGEPVEREESGQTWQGVHLNSDRYEVDYLVLPGSPLLRMEMRAADTAALHEAVNFGWQLFWNGHGEKKTAKTVHYWNHVGHHQLTESRNSRRVYGEARTVLELGKGIYAAAWSPQDDAFLTVIEMADKGLQLAMVQRDVQQTHTIYVAFCESKEDAMRFLQLSEQ
ncbi:GNAT family N-acetyltransferase [Tumebacillus sp. ITR2]|uniref:GNAT family N-acetyltransferase n=1 Tax=Tumebacillus amylolyticus TaxID=2801339 RepID=A0ABS1JA54_9BACL|nr:GNAT family N-acetyltransferase [Tumebacillus amylolyticus]MBL0387160.1 GNAT family N-acetyltransferase [Tumebacillus amylolyticus]